MRYEYVEEKINESNRKEKERINWSDQENKEVINGKMKDK